MAPQNPNPHDELKSLDQQVEKVNDLAGLKPIFFRLEEIARDHPNDFQVQLAVGDMKQHLVNRSAKIKQIQETMPVSSPPPLSPPGAPLPASPTVILTPMQAPPPLKPQAGPPAMPPPVAAASGPPRTPPAGQGVPPPAQGAPPAAQGPPPPPPMRPAAPPAPPINAAPPPIGRGPAGERPGPSPTVILPPNAGAPVPPPKTPQAAPPAAGSSGPPTMRLPAQGPPAPAQKVAPPVKPTSSSSGGWKKPVMIGGILGALLALGGVGFLIYNKRKGPADATTASSGPGVQVAINTTPPGAAIKIKSDSSTSDCNSNCLITLNPGTYQVTAFLDGYEPAASGLTVAAGAAAPPLSLTLEPQAQTVRLLTDLQQGKVTLDDQPAQDLQDGQFVLENVKPGTHVVRLVSRLGEAQFTVEVANGSAPKIAGPVVAKNLFGVLVSSIGAKAHVATSSGPLKLMANGQPEGDVNQDGLDLKNFQGGVLELVTGEGKEQRTVKENYGPAPELTAFFKSDQNIGTLVIATSEDDTRVFLNGKEYPRRTQKGQLRISTLGPVTVRVLKDGFEPSAQQNAEIKKGAEVRMEFKLKPSPVMISLLIRGGTPGAEVLIDQQRAGVIGPDGTFSSSQSAGNHAIDIRRDQFTPKHFERTFRAGQPITISGADAALVAERVAPPPSPDKVTLGSNTPPPPKPVVQTARAGTMDDWESPGLWRKEEDTYIHRGAAFIPYKLPARGTFTYTVQLQKGGNIFRSGKIRWAVNYVDAKNYSLYEIDNKNFWAKVVENGKTFERAKMPHQIDSKDKSFTVRIDVMPDHITQSIQRMGEWVVLDDWREAGRNFSDGKFGFLVQGDDQIGISDFHFQPK